MSRPKGPFNGNNKNGILKAVAIIIGGSAAAGGAIFAANRAHENKQKKEQQAKATPHVAIDAANKKLEEVRKSVKNINFGKK